MDRIPSSNNERAVPPVPKEIYGPNYLRDNVILLEMQNSKELKEEFSSIDFLWLRRNTPWPKLVKSAIYRYLHFHDLYQVDRDHEVNKLVDYIFRNGELPDDLHCREQMIHRCKKLILSTSKWTMKGLLVFNKDDRLVKSAMFQNAWNNQLLIMRNKNPRTNLANVDQFEDTTAVEQPNSPAKVLEASAVPDLSVEVSSTLPREGQPDAPFVTFPETETDIKIDPDGPMNLTNEHPKRPLIPVLVDAPSNTKDTTYEDGPDTYCHGLPNLECNFQDIQVSPAIPASVTHVPPSPKIIVQNVVFLKDLVCHNYLSEETFLCQKRKFEASAYLFVPVTNNINQIATYSAIVLIWQSDGQFLRFWRSLIDPNYNLIEFTFASAPWLSGFTIDTNNHGDLIKARQHIWDGFWIFVDMESISLNPKFRILAKPKLSHLLSVPSKRPIDSMQHDIQRPCPRGKNQESSSNNTNEGEISSPISDGQVPNVRVASCDRIQSNGQIPISQILPTPSKRPVGRPRIVRQQSNIALSPFNAQINYPNMQQQQRQRQWFRQCQSPMISDVLGSNFNPSPCRSPNDLTIKTQQNHSKLHPQGSILLAEPLRLFHANTPRVSYRSLQQYPNTQSSVRQVTQVLMNQAQRLPIPGQRLPQMHPSPSMPRLITDPSQIHPSFVNYPPRVLSYPPSSPLSQSTSPQCHDPTASSIPNPIPTIQFRIQISPNGPFSRPYPKSILGIPGQPPITTAQLFSWFVNEIRISNKQVPGSLTFRLKDAVPVPVTYTISRSGCVNGVDRLAKLRASIKSECENSGRLIMGLEKFEIFVSMMEEEKETQGVGDGGGGREGIRE